MSAALPIDAQLDQVLAFARAAPSIVEYEPIARALDLDVAVDEIAPEYRLFRGDGFRLVLVDGQLARVHCVSLGEDDGCDPATAARLGILTTDDCARVADAFDHLVHELEERLGAPILSGSWRSTCLLHEEEHDYWYAAWVFEDSVLVLLLDEEGDAHVGELGALDLRIAPRSAADCLPDSVRQPFGWPIDP